MIAFGDAKQAVLSGMGSNVHCSRTPSVGGIRVRSAFTSGHQSDAETIIRTQCRDGRPDRGAGRGGEVLIRDAVREAAAARPVLMCARLAKPNSKACKALTAFMPSRFPTEEIRARIPPDHRD